MVGNKDKIINLFKTNTTKDYSKATHIKNKYGRGKKPSQIKMQKQSEGNINQV